MAPRAVVVGSGPAGIACARALLKQGVEVTLLDGGHRLESERERAVEQLSRQNPEQFDPRLVSLIKENMDASPEGVPLKVAYGSDFPYRDTDRFIPTVERGFSASPSLARGGLGNVWGASMLPFREDDIADWPITIRDLAPHYEAVLSFVPLSGRLDALASILPTYSSRCQELRPSRQAARLLARMEESRDALAAEGMTFGTSRLAIQAETANGKPGCAYCGLCMYGCPYGAIYNPAATLDQMRNEPGFRYVGGVAVERIEEKGESVRIRCTGVSDGNESELDAERLYLASGTLSTTRLLLESMEAYGQPVRIIDSQYYLFPLLGWKMVEGLAAERLHTLAQLYIEIHDERISPFTVHLQIYSYNDLLPAATRKPLGPLAGLAKPLVDQLVGRLLIAQGYLHSNLSAEITAKLERPEGGARSRLVVEGRQRPEALKAVKAIMSKLMRNRTRTGHMPVFPMLKMALAGRSYHHGGTFPMASNPGPFQSDVLGRPRGFERVHVVDSSVFPSIPATTITLSAMANAHRIGWAYHEA